MWRTPREKYEKLQKEPGIVYLREGESADDFAEDAQVLHRAALRAEKGAPRHGRSEVLLRHYYILDGVVYEAPTLKAILRARLKKIAWHLSEAWSKAVVAPPQPLQQQPAAAGEARRRRRTEQVRVGSAADRSELPIWEGHGFGLLARFSAPTLHFSRHTPPHHKSSHAIRSRAPAQQRFNTLADFPHERPCAPPGRDAAAL